MKLIPFLTIFLTPTLLWAAPHCKNPVVVAVVDSGIDAEHEFLKDNLWHDPENPKIYGYDFVEDHANPSDNNGHGTHIAGIIKAINPCVKIMAIKYYDEKLPGKKIVELSAKAINYAVEHGANIINYSGGGVEFDEQEYLAVKNAEEHGVVLVSAAGNDHHDSDIFMNWYYPTAYHLSNAISVASVGSDNSLSYFSNWGKSKVLVGASGESIYSSLPNNQYGSMSGTSQATAVVSGFVSNHLTKKATLKSIKDYLTKVVKKSKDLKDKIALGGSLPEKETSAKLLKKRNLSFFD